MRQQEWMLGAAKGSLSDPRSQQGCPRWVVKHQALEQGACVSRRRPPQVKVGLQGGGVGSQGQRRTLR